MLFHQYHPGTFTNATIDSSVFNIPDICTKTTTMCEVQPTNFCGDGVDDDESTPKSVPGSFIPHY
jgi:hypothetical protein